MIDSIQILPGEYYDPTLNFSQVNVVDWSGAQYWEDSCHNKQGRTGSTVKKQKG